MTRIVINEDGLESGKPVTFDQIAKANRERLQKAKENAEVKAKPKAKVKAK